MTTTNREKQALKAIKFIAKINKKDINDEIKLPTFDEEETGGKSGDFRLLLNKENFKSTLIIWYTW